MRLKIILFNLLLFKIIFLIGQDTHLSDPIIIGENFEKTSLIEKTEIYYTIKKYLPGEVLLNPNNDVFKAPRNTYSPGFSLDYYWIFFKIINNSKSVKNLILECDNPHIDSSSFYIKKGNLWQFIAEAGDRMEFDARPIANRRIVFPITIEKQDTAIFALMVDKRIASVSFPLKIWDYTVFNNHERSNNLFYFLYFGGILFISVFSFFIGLIMKNIRLINYSIYSGLMGFYLFIALGFAFQYLYPNSIAINNYIRTQTVLLLLVSFLIFSISYLNLKKYFKLSYYILLIITLFVLALFAISIVFRNFAFANIIVLLKILYIFIIFAFPIVIGSVIKIYRKNTFAALTYILAISALFAGSLTFSMVEFGFVDESTIMLNPILVGSIIELFIFSTSFIIEIKKINDKKNYLLESAALQQKELMKAYIQGTDEEGNRISQELHDNIGSRLALLKNQIYKLNDDPYKLEADISEIFKEVKNISNELSPNSLHIAGLTNSVQSFAQSFIESTNIQVTFSVDETIKMEAKTKLQIYRVIQEALHNIQKHSEATKVDIQIFKQDNKVIISIDDDGKGFSFDNIKYGKGLNNMKMRIESINGIFEISSQPNRGTHIMIWI